MCERSFTQPRTPNGAPTKPSWMSAGESPALRRPGAQSWLVTSASFAHPDPAWPLTGFVELRDDDGKIADGFDSNRLSLSAQPAQISEGLTRVAPGLYRFTLAAPAGTGGQNLRIELSFDGHVVVSKSLPIAVDRWLALDGASAQGGCSVSSTSSAACRLGAARAFAGFWLLGLAFMRRRRYMRAKYAVQD